MRILWGVCCICGADSLIFCSRRLSCQWTEPPAHKPLQPLVLTCFESKKAASSKLGQRRLFRKEHVIASSSVAFSFGSNNYQDAAAASWEGCGREHLPDFVRHDGWGCPEVLAPALERRFSWEKQRKDCVECLMSDVVDIFSFKWGRLSWD